MRYEEHEPSFEDVLVREPTSRNLLTLRAYQAARELKRAIFALTQQTPSRGGGGDLRRQIERSVTSVSANIAEGYGRYGLPDRVQFFVIARASVNELADHLHSLQVQGLLSEAQSADLDRQCDEVAKLVNGYIEYLRGFESRPRTPSDHARDDTEANGR